MAAHGLGAYEDVKNARDDEAQKYIGRHLVEYGKE
jgi:hypothetical protein